MKLVVLRTIMEAAFASQQIGVDGTSDDNKVPITAAVLTYCEKLANYVANMTPDSRTHSIADEQIGEDLITRLRSPNVNILKAIRESIAQAISYDMENEIEDDDSIDFYVNPYGMSRIPASLASLFDWDMLDRFQSTLTYAIYSCISTGNAFTGADLWYQVVPTAKRLDIPTDLYLITGIMISQSVNGYNNLSLTCCLCMEGVPVRPDVDWSVDRFIYDSDEWHQWDRGDMYRLKIRNLLASLYITGLSYESQGYVMFKNLSLLQGIESMDKFLNSSSPSYTSVDFYHNHQWLPAIVN